ncbi:hypothetical protein HMPREF0742_02585 [Rothia aeria F0184]|uniref:Uncharacterized protein n=1 Tax=Rothia aeria F0184 TaxID=888019 RepID=U7UZ46_9MICC|nr:hypothetical protein HMPREF0742_02585 [Rothia aeria F0184]
MVSPPKLRVLRGCRLWFLDVKMAPFRVVASYRRVLPLRQNAVA